MPHQESRPPARTGTGFFYGYAVVAAAMLIVLLHYGTRSSFGIFFKPMLAEFGWTRGLTSGAFTLSMLFQGVGSIFMGRLNDKLGPRFVMTLCGFLLGAGYLLMSRTDSSWQLYLFYGVVVGTGMSGAFVALLSTAARWFVKRRGMMTGIVIGGIGVGTFLVPPAANWLISVYDWRPAYAIMGGVLLVISVLAAQVLRRDPARMGLEPYGDTGGKEAGPAFGDRGFSLREAAVTRQFWMLMIIYFCFGYSVFTINVHLVPHVTDLGIAATTAASVLAAAGAMNAAGCVGLGGAADSIGSRRVSAISFILIAAGVFWLVPISEAWMFYLFAVVYGIGSGGGAPVESTMTAELFGMKSHGLLLGVVSFSFTIGGAFGPFLTGYLFDVNGSYQTAFLICASVGALGFIFSVLLRPMKGRKAGG